MVILNISRHSSRSWRQLALAAGRGEGGAPAPRKWISTCTRGGGGLTPRKLTCTMGKKVGRLTGSPTHQLTGSPTGSPAHRPAHARIKHALVANKNMPKRRNDREHLPLINKNHYFTVPGIMIFCGPRPVEVSFISSFCHMYMTQCRLVWLAKLLQTAETTLGETIPPSSPHEPQRTLQTPKQRPQFPPQARRNGRTDTKRVWLGTLTHPPPQLPKPGRKLKASGPRPCPPPAVKTATCP